MIEIFETDFFGKLLYLNGDLQLATHDEWIYHEVLVHPAMLVHPNPKHVLIIGGGDGGALREVLKHSCVKMVTLVDIDPEVIKLSKKHLPEVNQGAFDNPKVKIVIEDGREFLKSHSGFDVVIADLTEPANPPSTDLFRQGFYKIVKSSLTVKGVLSAQIQSSYFKLHLINFFTIVKTLNSVFNRVRPYRAWIPSYGFEWGFAVASDVYDPMDMSEGEIDKRLRERGVETRYYDPEIHKPLFTLPKNIRQALEETEGVVSSG